MSLDTFLVRDEKTARRRNNAQRAGASPIQFKKGRDRGTATRAGEKREGMISEWSARTSNRTRIRTGTGKPSREREAAKKSSEWRGRPTSKRREVGPG